MKAEELRIGNLIFCRGEIIKVTMIGEYGIQSKTNDATINAKFVTGDLQPIPLTEQWLIDFGFEKKSWFTKGIVIECIYYQLADLIVYLVDDFFEIEVVTKAGQFNLFKKWNHVHQLQNLYFALTGEELQL